MAVTNDVITPVVLLDPSFWFLNVDLTRGDYFELPNPQMASILAVQDVQVSPVLESTLVAKDDYYEGIVRTSLGTGAPPVYQSSVVGVITTDDVIQISFDINVFATSADGWTVEVDASPVPVTRVYTTGTTMFIELGATVVTADVVTVSYVDTGKTVSADSGDFMATLLEQTVTNNT